jgi:hypothetical protein
MKIPLLTLLILGAAISTGEAQVTREWVARYASATTYSDIPYAMTVGADGHVYVTGTTGTSSGGHDWTTIKYNSAGVQQWLRTQDGGGNDAAFAIKTDEAGNVYVTGSSAGGFYFMTAKYSAAGEQLWVQFFTTIGEGDAGVDLCVDDDGNVYVTGYNVETATGLDIMTIKYSPSGVELWVKRFDSANGEDVPAAIGCDASGVYVTGRSGGVFTTIKYDFDGNQQWLRNYSGGFGSNYAAALIVAGGNVYVTGTSTGNGTNDDYATIKYDTAGNELWVRRYDGPSVVFAQDYDRPAGLAVDVNGNVLVTGNSSGDFATVKYNAAGTQMWVQRYNGPAAAGDWATAIAVDASGNAYVSGTSYGGSTTLYDFATLSYDPSGTVRWTERYNGPANNYDNAYSIAVNSSGDVYVSGSDTGSGTAQDYATIKYAPTAPSAPPTIVSFAPASGAVGTAVTITGTNFVNVSAVTFNLTSASYTVLSATQIQATVPANASTGRIRVTTPGGTATSGSDFTVTTPPQPTTLTFTPPHDAWVRASSPSSNFGERPELRVRGGNQTTRSYLKFDVSGVTGPIQSATLRLRVIDAGPDGGSVFSVSNNFANTSTPWTESGLTWNNAPALSGSALDAAGPVVTNTWLELDVTTAVTGNGTFSFALSGSSNNVVDYSSSEGANSPQLVVVVASGSAAPPVGESEAPPVALAPHANGAALAVGLHANTPNPFKPSTTIRYSLPRATQVSIVIYDINGRVVRRLVDRIESAGERNAMWDGRDDSGSSVGSGVYLVALEAGGTRLTRKMSLLK